MLLYRFGEARLPRHRGEVGRDTQPLESPLRSRFADEEVVEMWWCGVVYEPADSESELVELLPEDGSPLSLVSVVVNWLWLAGHTVQCVHLQPRDATLIGSNKSHVHEEALYVVCGRVLPAQIWALLCRDDLAEVLGSCGGGVV